MERYTPQERGFIVTAILTNFKSVVLTQREFRHRFPCRRVPCARTIKRLAERLVQTGSTTDVLERIGVDTITVWIHHFESVMFIDECNLTLHFKRDNMLVIL